MAGAASGTDAGAGGVAVLQAATWAEYNPAIPSRNREAVAETDAVVGCSDHSECDSSGSASRFGPQTRLRMRFLLLLLKNPGTLRLKPKHGA